MSDTQNWTDALAEDQLRADEVLAWPRPDGRGELALYRVDGEVFATDNRCTHGDARLCEGFLLGHEIECPLHQGRFDIRDGQPQCAPLTEPLRCHPVRVQGGRVWVALD